MNSHDEGRVLVVYCRSLARLKRRTSHETNQLQTVRIDFMLNSTSFESVEYVQLNLDRSTCTFVDSYLVRRVLFDVWTNCRPLPVLFNQNCNLHSSHVKFEFWTVGLSKRTNCKLSVIIFLPKSTHKAVYKGR